MNKNTFVPRQYEVPEMSVVEIYPQQCLATSDTLNDLDNNPLYHEDF